MKKLLTLNKKVGETPLECLERFRHANPQYSAVPMTYAGRLDPMAEGLLLVLTGEECKEKEKYLALDKEYETEILFGISTDTHDVLGIPTEGDMCVVEKDEVSRATSPYMGKITQRYPIYSSKTVAGVPLFELARRGLIDDAEIPTKDVQIYSIDIVGERDICAADLKKTILEKIAKVKGDFRQKEIIKKWQDFFAQNPGASFSVFTLKVICSSGTYIRALAENLGRDIGTGALALSIRRVRVGEYVL